MRLVTRAELVPYLIFTSFSGDDWVEIRKLLGCEQMVYVSRIELQAVLGGPERAKLIFKWDASKVLEVLNYDNSHLGYLHLRF